MTQEDSQQWCLVQECLSKAGGKRNHTTREDSDTRPYFSARPLLTLFSISQALSFKRQQRKTLSVWYTLSVLHEEATKVKAKQEHGVTVLDFREGDMRKETCTRSHRRWHSQESQPSLPPQSRIAEHFCFCFVFFFTLLFAFQLVLIFESINRASTTRGEKGGNSHVKDGNRIAFPGLSFHFSSSQNLLQEKQEQW